MLKDQMAVDISQVAEEINTLGKAVIFLGDGVPVFRERLKELMKVPFTFAPAHLNKQRAGAVAALALQYVRQGRTETAAEYRPDYLRMPQAERERMEREGKYAGRTDDPLDGGAGLRPGGTN